MQDQVYDWRRHVFRSLGFTATLADYLALTKIDLETSRNLVKQGCPLDLLLMILAGTNHLGDDDFVEIEPALDSAAQTS